MILNQCTIKWHKVDPKAIIPTKTDAAAGYDIYTTECDTTIKAHEQHLFTTGLQVAPSEGYWLMVFDRGSTGSRGLHVHCGVVDNDYRGELFICIKNDNWYDVIFDEGPMGFDEEGNFHYAVSKAIAQIIPVAQPITFSEEISDKEWELLKDTERGEGKLGSSGK